MSLGINISYGDKWDGKVIIVGSYVVSFSDDVPPSLIEELRDFLEGEKIRISSFGSKQKEDGKKPKPAKPEKKIVLMEKKKPVSNEEVKKKMEDEKAIKELNCWGDFDDFSNEIGMLLAGDKGTLLVYFDKLKNLYGKYSDIEEYMKENTSFYFCCGLFAYYLSEEMSGVDGLKAWFSESLGTEMTKENAIMLIKKSPGDHAYFFLQNLDLENHI